MNIYGKASTTYFSLLASPITFPSDGFSSHIWVDYVVKLSIVLCSFLYTSEDFSSHHVQKAFTRIAMPGYPVSSELSVAKKTL